MLALNLDLVALDQLTTLLLDYALYPFITLLMCLLSVFIVLGNLLVVTAIWHENQLHSVTNYLIASLAAADCLVGALVMPFSIISEMIVGSWTFGPAWCDLWHSFDVLASTASIMNLCAISLDRYLAITNPICYPTKMTPKRVALLIVSLWTCSALISFPAILWWRAVGNGPLQLISPANVSQVVARDSSNSNRANSSSNNEISSSVSHGERVTQEQQQQRQQQQQQLQTVISSTVRPTTGYFKSIEDEQSLGASNHNNNNDNVISSRLGIGENENNSREFYSHHGHQLQAINHRSTSDLNNAIQRETPPSSSSSDSDSANLVASLVTDEPIYKCVFTDDTYYLLFSSFVSFYGPLCVMLYAYICIYKAAIQQTRFLKHGSKQVMIGGSGNGGSGGGSDGTGSGKKNKKNRRYRNASEHSHQSGADRGMDPSASCDGSCDNFERQHLVLRAHRGGGGGSVAVSKQTSKSSTSAGGDSPTAARPATGSFQHPSNKHLRSGAQFKSRHKNMREANAASEQQACLTEDDGDDEDEDESELDSGNQTTNHLESLGQQHHHNNQTNVSQSSGSFHGSSSGGVGSFRPRTSSPSRSHRINLTLSKRDRMRVESQRFTASNAISIELNDENKNNNKLKPLTPNERDAIEPSSPAATTCWRKLQPRSALGIDQNHSSSNHHHHQKQCDSLEDNQTSQDSTIQFGADPQLAASDELMRRSDSANSGGRSGGVGFRFVNALRRGDSRATPPLPASLVPLIMMNSDTSTDSSIVTVVTRPTAPMLQRSSTVEHSSSNNKNTPAAAATTTTTTTPATAKHADGKVGDKLSELNNSDVEHYVLNLTTSPTVEPCSGRDGNSDSGSIRSSVELTPETKHTSGTRRPNQVTINLSFDDSAESRSKRASGLSGVRPENSTTSGASATSKGQILHYDSDKLIQSIVDLTNIHYIDCAVTSNQTPVSTNRVAVCEGSGVGGGSGAKFANSTTMPIEVADVVVVPPALEIGTKTQTTKGILSKTSSNSVGSAGGGGPQADSHHQLVGQMVTVELNQNNQNHYTTTTTTTTTTSGGDTSSTNANRMLPPPNGASSMGVTRVVRTKQPSITTTISTPTLTTRPEVLPPPPPTTTAVVLAVAAATNNTATTTNGSPTQNVPRQQKSMGRKLTKLAKERKAAKTLGIVVGVFILCWLPFFVVNILVALCGTKCIYKPHILNSVVTWLGWLNSAMNPVIYACWSRDFRRAFRRVLCTWVEFVCYDGTRLAQKLKLKKSSGYSTNAYEVHSTSRPASSTQRSGASIEANAIAGSGGGGGGGNGGVVVVGVPTSAIGGAGGFCG